MAVRLDLVGAGADQVSVSSAQLAALAELPANAHLAFVVFFHCHMALKVAVISNNDTFESGHGALVMSFSTKEVIGRGAFHHCGFFCLLVGVADAATDVGVGWGSGNSVFGCLELRTDMHVFVEDEVV